MSLWQYTPDTKTANTSDEALNGTFYKEGQALMFQLVVKHTDETTWSGPVEVSKVHDLAVAILPMALLKKLRDAVLAQRYTDNDPTP